MNEYRAGPRLPHTGRLRLPSVDLAQTFIRIMYIMLN